MAPLSEVKSKRPNVEPRIRSKSQSTSEQGARTKRQLTILTWTRQPADPGIRTLRLESVHQFGIGAKFPHAGKLPNIALAVAICVLPCPRQAIGN